MNLFSYYRKHRLSYHYKIYYTNRLIHRFIIPVYTAAAKLWERTSLAVCQEILETFYNKMFDKGYNVIRLRKKCVDSNELRHIY